MVQLLHINPFVMFYKKYFLMFTFYHCFSIRVRMSWKIGENRNLFLKLKSKMGLSHVVFTTPKAFLKVLKLTLVQTQQIADNEETDCKEKLSCPK